MEPGGSAGVRLVVEDKTKKGGIRTHIPAREQRGGGEGHDAPVLECNVVRGED
ncbi:hypothetical protein ACFO9E_06655 [Streptomyces maoxianensis]|uniref:Uncharacterized protein n=1 Tax=Streptomyces maoxianensis TaxID=1459942 RepID=A0ABV9FZP2_9ACTN